MKPEEEQSLLENQHTDECNCLNCFCDWLRSNNEGPGNPSSVCSVTIVFAGFIVGVYFLVHKVIAPKTPSIEHNCNSITYTDLAGQDTCFEMIGISPESSSYHGNTTLCPYDNSKLNVNFFKKYNWQAVTFSSSNDQIIGTATVLYSGHIDKVVGDLTFTKRSECSIAVSYTPPPVLCTSMTYINNDQQGCGFSLTNLNPAEATWTGPTDLTPEGSATAFYNTSPYITTDFDIYCTDYVGHATLYSQSTGKLNINGPVTVEKINDCTLAISYAPSSLFHHLRGDQSTQHPRPAQKT